MNKVNLTLGLTKIAVEKLNGRRHNPFYIVSPPYSRNSAAARILFLLCHYLNTIGEDAFIFPYPLELDSNQRWPYFCRFPKSQLHDSNLNIRLLSQKVVDEHFECGLTPICIVPDVHDNPILASFVVRFVLDTLKTEIKDQTTHQQYTCAYSQSLARYSGTENVLCIPVVDTGYFSVKSDITKRGSCYYICSELLDMKDILDLRNLCTSF